MDIEALIARYGEAFTLWDFYEPCRAPGCDDGLLGIHASPGGGTPYSPLQTYNVWKGSGPGEWLYLRQFPDQPEFGYGVTLPWKRR